MVHSTTFRSATSFIHFSRLQSTRCRCCCARLAACLSCGFVMVFFARCTALGCYKNSRQTLACHCCCISHRKCVAPYTAPWQALAGNSVVPPPLPLTASSSAPVWTGLPNQLCFIWPQALLPFLLRTNPSAQFPI